MYWWENDKFYQSTSGVNSACGKEVICIDDTQGFDGVRYYKDYVPTLRSQRSGLKVAYVGAAMRGRYDSDGKIEQQIEVRNDELSNAITTVQKDSLVVEKKSWLEKKYVEFYEKHGYIPEYFIPYNGTECTDYAPTLTANSNTSPTHAGTVLITEVYKENKF